MALIKSCLKSGGAINASIVESSRITVANTFMTDAVVGAYYDVIINITGGALTGITGLDLITTVSNIGGTVYEAKGVATSSTLTAVHGGSAVNSFGNIIEVK